MDTALQLPRSRWHYPAHYPWLITLGVLDVTFTWLILGLGGSELNGIAAWVIARGGLPGMILLKAAAVGTVLAVCERLARLDPDVGRRIAALAVAANTVPVTVGAACLAEFTAGLLGA